MKKKMNATAKFFLYNKFRFFYSNVYIFHWRFFFYQSAVYDELSFKYDQILFLKPENIEWFGLYNWFYIVSVLYWFLDQKYFSFCISIISHVQQIKYLFEYFYMNICFHTRKNKIDWIILKILVIFAIKRLNKSIYYFE